MISATWIVVAFAGAALLVVFGYLVAYAVGRGHSDGKSESVRRVLRRLNNDRRRKHGEEDGA